MIVYTHGLEVEEVLAALYNYALICSQSPVREAASHISEEGFFVRAICKSHVVPTEGFAAKLVAETPNLFFKRVMLDDRSIDLNVLLNDPHRFDASEYDDLYGEGAAAAAIEALEVKKNKGLNFQTSNAELVPVTSSEHQLTKKSSTPRWDLVKSSVLSMFSTGRPSAASSMTGSSSPQSSTLGAISPVSGSKKKLEI